MPMAVKRSKSKPEVEFQDGGHLFSETGSSNISAVDWDIWSKFGTPIALGLPTCGRWPNQKPEVDLWRYGCRLVKSIWRHNSVGDHPICIQFGRPVQNHMPMTVKSSSKPGVEFKYGGRLFSATRNSNNLAVDWDIWLKFDTQMFFTFLKARCHKNRKHNKNCVLYSQPMMWWN